MKKIILVLIVAIICAGLIGTADYFNKKSDEKSDIIQQIDKKTMEDKQIGAEPPKLLYADHNKVIFESVDIYVYDLKRKMLLKSFDISSLLSKTYKNCRISSRVSQDGTEIYVGMIEDNGTYVATYSYSFGVDKWSELEEAEYKRKSSDAFVCTLIDADNELSKVTSGYAVYLSGSEYFYLTFEDWKISEMQIVYVKDGGKTVYKIWDNNSE